MKSKQSGDTLFDRCWDSLQKAVGEDPGEFGIKREVDTFDAFLLASLA